MGRDLRVLHGVILIGRRRWRLIGRRKWWRRLLAHDSLRNDAALYADAARQEAAVDDDGVAVGVAGGGAHQVNGGADQLLGLAEAALGRVRLEELAAGCAFDELAV